MNAALLFNLIVAGGMATFVWRFAGIVASSHIDPDGPVLRWVRAVATALVAALVARFIYAPSGLLAETQLISRILALLTGTLAFIGSKQRLEIGVGAAVGALFLLEALGKAMQAS
jgi:branched-subunit amino acid transport protein